ncbi:MAG: adenylate/guanylate cyclase domain-containing protein [Candidatus Gracilibacteria bacterium]|nr:adenylate/guanylate cyclase domain-containing protein [Candidatus Gracilibacteria bacterium]
MNLKKIAQDKKNVSIFLSLFILIIVLVLTKGSFSKEFIEQGNLGIKNILFTKYGNNRTANKNITIVAIDNKTLSDDGGLGRFQNFKRSYYAQVIDNLKKDGASVVGIDVLFSEKSEEDASLERSLKDAGNVILGFSLAENLFPIPTFKDNALGTGYFHPYRNKYNDTVYSIIPQEKGSKAFSFEILQKYFDANPQESRGSLRIQGSVYPFGGSAHDKHVPYSSSDAGDIYINYLPEGSKFQQISFVDAYNGTYDPGLVKGKIILIGSTATALYDKFNTPQGIQDGIFIHANMINTVLNQEYIVEVEQWKEVIILVALTFLLVLFTLYVKNRVYQLLFLLVGFIILFGAEIGYFSFFQRLFTLPIQLIIIVILTTLFVTGYKYIYEESGKRALKGALSQYLSEELVVNILDKFEEVKLDGKRMTVTSFFSDIAGFTSISENMEPEELVRFLSIYLKEVSDIIMHDKGFINKYEGDAVMALWGAFGGDEKEQATLACRAALAQQTKIQEINEEFRKNHGFEISVRMGINKGVAVVGNIGSVGKKIEYTALGDSVNTASRFEGINKLYGTLICVGESVMEEAKEFFVFRKLDSIQVKGKEKPVFIYELVGEIGKVPEEKLHLIKEFEKALEFYVVGNIVEGKEIFKNLHEKFNDGPSLTFLNRCGKLIEDGVPEGWQGVYRATEK